MRENLEKPPTFTVGGSVGSVLIDGAPSFGACVRRGWHDRAFMFPMCGARCQFDWGAVGGSDCLQRQLRLRQERDNCLVGFIDILTSRARLPLRLVNTA